MTDIKDILASIVCIVIVAVGCYLFGRADGRNLERKAALESAMEQVEKTRAEDKRRIEEQERIANEAMAQREKAVADARAASDVSRRLQQRINDLNGSINTATVNGSKATYSTLVLYTDLFSRAEGRTRDLAEYADAARIAGHACEREYNALTE